MKQAEPFGRKTYLVCVGQFRHQDRNRTAILLFEGPAPLRFQPFRDSLLTEHKEEDSDKPPQRSIAGFRRLQDAEGMVGALRDGDGVDPREERRVRQRSQSDRKPDYAAERLASQIARCVDANLGDGILAEFAIQDVRPGRGNHFVIELRARDPSLPFEVAHVQAIAAARVPILRMELAREIHRKKVPNLSICILPSVASMPEPGTCLHRGSDERTKGA